ncbi:hypothetical protein [Novosphingobium sp. 9U]|uniref:hypothetical protein n=1 Tax=Novosphingobium sp. 9U TaxID=2653158 RepID=UPI001356A909|nr:hypothetical protein [Novosphingobium sp. 9U]
MLDSFAKCRTIAAAEARADCFDATARELEAAVKSKEVTILDRQDIRSARKSLFGFTLPRIGLFGGGDRDEGRGGGRDAEAEEIKELNTTIASARVVANGRVELRLAEGGAVWVTTDPMPFPPKPGDKVRIRSGSLGNYFIAVAGQRSVRGMRLR